MKRPAHTPELKADPEYLKAFATIMTRIGQALGTGAKDAPVVICVAGGAALHFYTGERVSKDIDARVMARFLPPDNLEVAYRDADGHARLLYFDTQYNDTFSLLHQDAYRDAIPIQVAGVNPRRLDIRLLTPLDLAVSKLSRFEAHDQDDIRSLARAGLVEETALGKRAEEALPDYVGNVERVKHSIALARRLVRESEKPKPRG